MLGVYNKGDLEKEETYLSEKIENLNKKKLEVQQEIELYEEDDNTSRYAELREIDEAIETCESMLEIVEDKLSECIQRLGL